MIRTIAARVYWSLFYRREDEARTWMHEPAIRSYINLSITGSPNVWPLEWFKERYPAHLARALSIGCGTGALERDLRRKEICREVEGLDISETALRVARRHAAAESIDGIEYRRGDFNALELEAGRYDAVFAHQALHHVSNLEGCIEAIHRGLSDGGYLIFDEYVGPSRNEWTQATLAPANRVFTQIPKRLRRRRRLSNPVGREDPSEAVRSSEIVRAVKQRFQIVAERPYGGNILALVWPHLKLNLLDEYDRTDLLNSLIEDERKLLRDGADSYYTLAIMRAA